LKTYSGNPKDTGVTLFTLETPGNPLRYNTPRSSPPVSVLAHSRGPRKLSHSRLERLNPGEAQSEFPKGECFLNRSVFTPADCECCVAAPRDLLAARPTVHVSRLFVGSSSGLYGIRYIRVFDYVSVSQCDTGPAWESEVYPQVENKTLTMSVIKFWEESVIKLSVGLCHTNYR